MVRGVDRFHRHRGRRLSLPSEEHGSVDRHHTCHSRHTRSGLGSERLGIGQLRLDDRHLTPLASNVVSTPSVPADWYKDPAGRYEFRYWDGTKWTEHVSRGGVRYSDPPTP